MPWRIASCLGELFPKSRFFKSRRAGNPENLETSGSASSEVSTEVSQLVFCHICDDVTPLALGGQWSNHRPRCAVCNSIFIEPIGGFRQEDASSSNTSPRSQIGRPYDSNFFNLRDFEVGARQPGRHRVLFRETSGEREVPSTSVSGRQARFVDEDLVSSALGLFDLLAGSGFGLRQSLVEDPVDVRRETVTSEIQEQDHGNCVVCLEGFERGGIIARLPCDHILHNDCAMRWFESSKTCPTCRCPIRDEANRVNFLVAARAPNAARASVYRPLSFFQ
mmetsp:Transcript_8739/g.16027  ORF Transcript_8739/g.16027 Transcript_8739/m.16027 type:complete len:278 (+) Transcript_8739:248-1081(+)